MRGTVARYRPVGVAFATLRAGEDELTPGFPTRENRAALVIKKERLRWRGHASPPATSDSPRQLRASLVGILTVRPTRKKAGPLPCFHNFHNVVLPIA